MAQLQTLQGRDPLKCVGKAKGAYGALRFPEARTWRKLLLPGPEGTSGPVRAGAVEERSAGGSSSHGRSRLQPGTQRQSREGPGKKPSPVSLSCCCRPAASPSPQQPSARSAQVTQPTGVDFLIHRKAEEGGESILESGGGGRWRTASTFVVVLGVYNL